MQFILFDLEATCWKDSFSPYPQEIIEIGACKLSPYGVVIETFSSLIIPSRSPVLSQYCKSLTGIQQNEIDRAKSFKVVMHDFENWATDSSSQLSYFSWGAKDYNLLRDDSQYNNIELEWLEDIYDLKQQYGDIKGLKKPIGLDKVLEVEGIEFEGTKHRAVPDAKNLTKLFFKYLDRWQY